MLTSESTPENLTEFVMTTLRTIRVAALVLALVHVTLCWPGWAQEFRVERRVILGPPPAVTVYGRPGIGIPWAPDTIVWSRDAEVRARQAIARQFQALDYVRWHAASPISAPWIDAWYGDPAFIWGLPYREAVEQPIGLRRIYDGRGGYSSVPVYADEPPVAVEVLEIARPLRDERSQRVGARPERPRGFSW
jgi:hypothetical protein